jgi:pimeloyl-ACP methyl ester carboxylesterase
MKFNTVTVEGLEIFYREDGDQRSPKLVLLHGYPASSHQYRNLIPLLAGRFHVVAPDYPGFGSSATPDPREFAYTFDHLAAITEAFLTKIGFTRFGLYMQDYGGPVGMRIATRHPDWVEWLIVQNSNAYEVGFTSAWDGLRHAYWKQRTPEVSPDGWNMDGALLARPNQRRIQLDLFYDYRTNVPLYPAWQDFLRTRQPKTIIFWGQQDLFFTPEGGEAYLRDLPRAEMHRLDSGHFATEDSAAVIAEAMTAFHAREVGSEGGDHRTQRRA